MLFENALLRTGEKMQPGIHDMMETKQNMDSTVWIWTAILQRTESTWILEVELLETG